MDLSKLAQFVSAAIPAGDDTPVLTYVLIGGAALLLIVGGVLLQVFGKKK